MTYTIWFWSSVRTSREVSPNPNPCPHAESGCCDAHQSVGCWCEPGTGPEGALRGERRYEGGEGGGERGEREGGTSIQRDVPLYKGCYFHGSLQRTLPPDTVNARQPLHRTPKNISYSPWDDALPLAMKPRYFAPGISWCGQHEPISYSFPQLATT